MARLREGEKENKEHQLHHLLDEHLFGIREAEIAEELGWDRRTVNNYLRELKERGLVYKEGRDWFAEDE
jgi:predicted transcriptional regulator